MTLTPLAISSVTATSVATIALAAVGEGMDAATITIIGTVACAIITSLTVAIVKILGALQALKVALVEAKQERSAVAEKVTKSDEKLVSIGASTDGNLSAMSRRLDEALTRIDNMQKAAASAPAQSGLPIKVEMIPPPEGAPPTKVEMVNTPEDPANVTNIEPKK